MNEFILIFRHEDGSKIASPEQMQIWLTSPFGDRISRFGEAARR